MIADLIVRSFHDFLTIVQSNHAWTELFNKFHIMFDHENEQIIFHYRIEDGKRLGKNILPITQTTRDFIEETVNIKGIPLRLIDTAGLHDTEDALEAAGVRFTRQRLDEADLVLFMVDCSSPLSDEDMRIYDLVCNRKTILVINKMDLVDTRIAQAVTGRLQGLPQEHPVRGTGGYRACWRYRQGIRHEEPRGRGQGAGSGPRVCRACAEQRRVPDYQYH